MIASARVKGEWWPTVSENVRGRLHIARREKEMERGRVVVSSALLLLRLNSHSHRR